MTSVYISEEHLSSSNGIFDLAPFPMWVYDRENYGFLAVNREAMHHYGYSREEFLSMMINDISAQVDIPEFERMTDVVLPMTDGFNQSLFCHQKKDGSIIYVQIKNNPVIFEGKQAVLVTAIDFTERYQQEVSVKRLKRQLKTTRELNDIILKAENWTEALIQCFQLLGKFLNVERIYFYQNNALEQATSQRLKWVKNMGETQVDNLDFQNIPFPILSLYTQSLIDGEHFEAIVSDLAPSLVKRFLQKQDTRTILAVPVMVNTEFSGFIRVDDCVKERKWQEDKLQLLKTLTSYLGHVIKKAQKHQDLVNSEAKFRSLVQNGSDLIAIVDAQGYYKYVAPTSTKVLGIPPEEFIGKSAFDFINVDDAPRIRKCLEQLTSQNEIVIEPYRFLDSQHNWRWIQTNLSNHSSDPAIDGIVANTKDVTAEVEKMKGERLLSSLTRIISQPSSLAFSLTKALKKLVMLSKINIGEIWLVSEDKSRIDLISKSYQNEVFRDFYLNFLTVDSFEKNQGLPGHIWNIQQPFVIDNLAESDCFNRLRGTEKVNLKTAIGIPLFYNDEFLGAIICFSSFEKQDLSGQIKLLTEVGSQIGSAVKQKVTEEHFRNFYNISPDLHCLLGFDGYLKKFNNSFEELLGFSRLELSSKPVFQFIHKDDKAKSEERLNSFISGDNSNSFETRFLTKTGEVKWLVWKGKVIPESKIIIAVAKDVTGQKIAEIELSTAYEKLKSAHKIAKLGYWLRDFDSDISEWSEETYAIHGYTPENFVPSMANVAKTFHPDDRHLIESNPNDKIEPGTVQSFEHRILTASNKIKWVHQEIRILTDEKQIPFRIEGTIQDITERKEYELQLALSNERFRLAIQASNEMIWEIDHQNQMISRSSGYEKLINYEASESFEEGNSWFRKIHTDDLEAVWNSLQAALKNRHKNSWSKEYKVLAENGSIAYFVDRCYILRDEKGDPLRSVGSALDVTVSRQQLEKIKQQNNKLREIAWLQSHVIRAPLSKIMGLIYLAKEHNYGGKSHEEIFDMISASAEELDSVIHDIIHKTEAIKEDDKANIIN
ncbi:PAS domain S-box protein [Algoriphagus sp. Y33]|uniref:PAS domain S-box protein n=1 Tax=Algoriphagus sp. Y33 TaxID=2772483 RepID=UPI00177C35F3|nr:PAS domain S-box protein [Algoriphagus sp. Y33]